jgi:multidrug efflux pump subunit AcrB
MNFVEKSLKYKQVTLSVLFLFFAVGVYSLLNMSRREDPKITVRLGLVIAYYPGASSTQVEEQLTRKVEEYLFRYEEVKKEKTYSSSEDGKMVITVELADNVQNPDMFWSKLREQLLLAKQIDLPDGVIGPIVNSDFGDTEAMIVGISGKTLSYEQLKFYAQRLEDQLRSVPSVSKVKREGELKEQIQVTTNSAKLAQYGIQQLDVIKILQSQNDIFPTGDIEMSSYTVPLYTKGYYNTLDELGNQIVGYASTGSVVKLKDIATLTRTYADATSMIKVNDEKSMIISIQMNAGNNIVKFGEAVNQTIESFKSTLPSDVKITTIADQPKMVDDNISHFIREFFLAIVAVVLVIIVMLPFRIAVVAAMAIPMTVAITLALMNFFGIELQQVSLAALIVVLGLVVDDAIVVADNYVELLDKGMKRWEAAWKSASELVIPIFVATITIILAFLPMVTLTGPVGEFISSLPWTVTIALSSSFIVAMFFTPLLCFTFIKKGLHDPKAPPKKGNVLDKMQEQYNKALDWCITHPKTTILFSIVPLFLAFGIYKYGIKEKFFPAAERNQFVVELWMPSQTSFSTTAKATEKLEALIKSDDRVVNYASFIGTSSPRFYYNFSPEFPVSNYAQIVVNTVSIKAADEFAAELVEKVEAAVPEGRPQVRLMQQGKPLKAPIEVRIWGDNIQHLKAIGKQVDSIIHSYPESRLVKNDFKEDYYGIDIQIKPSAERLGFTTEVIAKSVYAGFKGAPVTSIREGRNTIGVILKLNDSENQSIDDIQQMYITSPATGAKVPLEQIATLEPVWKTGTVMHLNGVRVLTVLSDAAPHTVPSELLKKIRPAIDQLDLPAGYHISYAGEYGNQAETFSEMIKALLISLLLIFFTLLFQFKNLKEAILIMMTIPLSLFGAMFGLLITGNNFGFTAFVGLISLSGVVVRNAIILIDHVHELVKHHDMDWRTAAIESGKRRLRPIFLTAMAAAIGVLPMILSGSPMWSPLASVIALGVVWSMVIALLTVPVIYLLWIVPSKNKQSSEH